ncbi:hypothetical protein HPG69_006536 [Diceros bicornis minor]|uniref:Uncharacterized protein n=1 Tax=Diceros bicornis minor TaxID=77932 RepID=A0A7J7F5Z6_DICBM|nr:hypothetical protein HPG69_006536 [Diceros bicornis minor]
MDLMDKAVENPIATETQDLVSRSIKKMADGVSYISCYVNQCNGWSREIHQLKISTQKIEDGDQSLWQGEGNHKRKGKK